MKKKGISRFGNLVLAIFLTLTCGAVLLDSNALEVLDDFGIKTEVTYSDAKDTAKIELDLEEVKEEFSIMEIIDPENEKMDFNNLTFDVQKNGEYIFKVKYLQKTRVLSENEPTTEGDDVTYSEAWILNGDEEEQTYDLKVKVDEIKTSEDTQTTIEENQGKKEIKEVGDALNVRGFSDKIEISPRSTATNNSVTIDIPDYNATTGWTRGDIKEVKVTVNFGDATSANKKVSITVPEGLRYEQISIKSDTNKTGADPKILTLYDAGDPIVTSATSITLPKLETVASKKSTFGKLEYQFLNTVQTVTIKFQVGVDITRYYGPHTVKNPISVDVRKGNNVLVGGSVVNQSVKLTGGVLSTGIITYYSTLTAAGSKEVIASTASDESLGRVNQYHLPLHNWEWKDTHRYAKSVTMDLYFPAGMEYHSITGLPAFTVVSKDNAAGRVTIKIDNWMTRQDFWLYYKVPIGKAVGTYNLTGKDKITYTWYDGTVESKTRPTSVVDYNTKVISTPVNKMTLSNSRDGYANADVEHYSRGTMWVFSNASAGKRTNQTVEFTIDPNWQAVMLHLPFDKTITTNKITKVYYKTNKSPTTWKEYNISTGLPLSGNVAVLKKTNMKNASGAALLASDEYFTAVKANIGSVSQDYTQSTNIDNNGNILVYGKFAPNSTVNEAPITISMYDESNKTATTVTGTRYVRKSLAGNKKVVSHSTVEFRDENNSIVSGITAGSSFKVNAKVSTRQVQQSTAQAMANPEIYLRQPKGMTIASDSITIKDNSGKAVAFDIAPLYQNKFGEKIYILKTKNCVLGLYLDENISINRTFNVSYTVGTDGTMAGGSMNARDLVSWGKDGYAPVSDGQTPGYVDAYDFNGNNNYTEQLLSFKDLPFTIAENKNVLVETFLSFAGQEPSAPYIEGVDSTLVYFTPGTQADYTVKMTNNSSSAAKTKVYIPIPKTNDNFGAGFQSTAFKWDMKLRSAVAAQSGFTVMYSTTATAANYEQAAQYKTAAQVNLADVKMVKIEATSMAVNATANFKIPLQINETFSSATQPGQEKVKTRNIYNPRYSVESASFNGNLPGTKVGAELIITEIGGTIFEDKNGNSIYDAGDLPVIGHSVELYKWDDVQKKYLVAKDKANKAITTVSNATGKYLFDNTLDLPKGTYAVKFAAKTNYQFVKTGSGSSDVDSNVIIADNLPKAGDKYKGWIIDIDGTLPIAKTMGCGFVKYNPATNLGLTLPTTTLEFKVDETRTMSPTSITPNYWETIKGNPGYKWELVTATDSQYVQLTAANQKQLTLKGLKKTPLGYEIQVKLTINDIYGGTKSATTKIKINTKVAPTITTSTINAYVGDQVNLLAGVSAKDDNNENIVITEEGALKNTTILNKDKISSSGGKYNKSETYKITYEVLDKYGNKGTKDRIIKVNGNPIITANAQVYQLGEADILTKVKNAAEASFMKASETPGNAATKTVFAMNAPTITGPTQDFTAVGKYQVTYSAKNEDNKSVSKTVDVIITNGIVPGNEQKGIEIRADNIVIERNELATFDLAKAMNKANVQAIYYERDDKKNLTKLDDITTSISVSSLDNIKKAPEKGGEYELTFTTTYSGVTSNKKILAVVVGNELKVQNGLVIKATDIDIENDAARVLTQSQAISLANVEAYVLQTKQATANNTVNTTQLNAIKAVTNDAQTFKLTYTATQDGKTVSIEKDVNVNHSLVGPVITADACEHYVGDKFEVLHDVSAKDVNNDAINLEMTGSNKNTEVEHQIPLENGEYKTAGTYEIKYAITDKYGNTTEKTRLVKVHAMPVIETNPQVYSLKDEDIAGQITAAASAYYNKADNAVGATPIKTKIDEISYEISGPSQDFSEVGTYEITYKSENVDGRKASKKVEVIITKNEPLPTDVDKGIKLDVYNFHVSQDELADLDEAVVIEKAQIQAMYFEQDDKGISKLEDITTIVRAGSLDEIKQAPEAGKVYKLSFHVTKEGITETKEIEVVVSGKNIEVKDGIVIDARDFDIENAEARVVSSAEAIDLAKVKAYVLETKQTISDVSVDTDQLDAIHAVANDAQTFKLTYTATQDGKTVSIEKNVNVNHSLVGPVITANDCEHYVGDKFEVLHDVSAKDVNNDAINLEMTGSNKNTEVEHQIPLENGEYKTAGTYEIKYAITDKYGNTTEKTRLVKVHAMPVIETNPQVYSLKDEDIAGQITAAANAYYNKAADTVGSSPMKTKIDDLNYDVAGPSSDFSVPGTYEITYKSENVDGRKASKKVEVIITKNEPLPTDVDKGIKLDVYNFHVSQDELADLDEAVVIEKAQIQAMYFEQDDKGISKLEDITTIVRAGSLDEIKQAPEAGKVYKLSFHVTKEGITETKEIEVVVSGKNIEVKDGIVIDARDFDIENAEARVVSSAEAIDLAKVKAYVLETKQTISDVTVDTDQLDAIHAVANDAQTFKLTYTATQDGKTVSIEKNVNVNHSLVGPVITANDCEHYVGDKFEVLHDVSAKDVNNDAIDLILVTPNKNTEVEHQIPLENGEYKTAGTYEIKYAITDKYGNTTEKTRLVKVHAMPVIETNPQVYSLKDEDIAGQITAAANAYYNKADDAVGDAPIKTKIDEISYEISGPSQDFSEVGTYEITYKVENVDGRKASKKVEVIITKNEPLPTDVDKGIKLDVYNFHVSQDELANLDEATVLKKAQAQAMYFEQDDEGVKKLEDITKMVRAGSLDEIKQAPGEGNVYKLSFHVTSEGITETKEVEVVVSGNSIVVTDGLVIEANDFSIANVLARILVKEKALELANAKAYELETRQMLNNISIDTDQLDAIHNVTNDAQTFKLTYTATHNNKTVSIEKDVRVNHTLIGPDITADDCEHYVGDKFEVLHDVSAKDANDDTIHFITDPEHPDKNIETTHQIPLDSDKFNTSGTYKITYAIMDKYGNTSEKIRTVKVHDVPVIEVNPQVYTLKDKDVADQIKAAASAYYYKAADVAGEPSIKTKIDEINYTSNGPSQDFSKVGTYEVTYEVELIDGRNVTKKVNVIITKNDPLPTDVDKGIKLDVYNFHVSQDELVDLDEAAVLEKAQAQAMYFENDDKGNVIKLDDITAKVVVGSLVDIKKASAEGGVYKLSFSVSDNKMVETKEVEVVVSGKSIKFENGVVLKANDITLPNADAKKITESKLLNLAGAQAYVLETNQQINVTADPIQLEAIKNVGNDKVSYPLNLSSTYDTTTIEMSIQVGVEHTLVKPIVKVVNKAVYVGDVYDMFEGVTAEDANNQLLVLDDDNTKVTHQMPLEDSKFKIVGTYQVVYEVKDKYGNVGEAKQKIRVNGLPELNTNPQTYALNDPDIMNKVEVNAFARYQKASEKIGGEPVWIELDISSEVIDGPDGDLQFNNIGIYIVKYATTNEDNRTTKKTTSVAVIHQGDIPDPTSLAYISAKGFIIDYTSVESLDEATILDSNHADVKAFKVLHDDNQQVIGSQDITDKVYVDKDKLAEIQKTNSNGKIYQLALRVEDDGNIVTRVINVVVSGSEVPIPQPTPDGNYLVITANDFRLTYDEAKNADETMVSEKANVKAMLLQPEMKNNIVKRMAATNAPLSVRINKRELQNIREVPELGGNYQLTFFAEYRLLDQLVAVNPISVNVKIVPKSSDDLYGNVINEKTKKEPKGMDKVIETGDTQTGWLWIVTMVLSFMFITKKGWKLLTKNKSSKK